MTNNFTYEEIKQLLKKTKNRADRYHAAYDELMKLDKDTCQADCRYYGLYKHLWGVFNPDEFNDRFYDMRNAELYFNLLNKCAENYDSEECYFYLTKCYIMGIGAPIDDEKALNSAKSYFKTKFYPEKLKDVDIGEMTIDGTKVEYRIYYTYFNKIRHENWWLPAGLDIYSYRSLTTQEIEEMGKDYLVELRKFEKRLQELQQNS